MRGSLNRVVTPSDSEKMKSLKLLTAYIMAYLCGSSDGNPHIFEEQSELKFVSREAWGAREPNGSEPMTTPVNYVVIHHTYIPGACATQEACERSTRSMQKFHMDTRKWLDIGYSFVVGGDNRVYVGRGWDKVGAHSKKYNTDSIGIAVVGNWTTVLPPKAQLDVTKSLISYGVQMGKIGESYKLIGHRQGANTECPGDALFAEIQTWQHWSPTDNH